MPLCKKNTLVLKDISKYFLIIATVLLLGFIIYLVSPFLVPIIMAAIIASVATPVQRFWVKLFRGHQKWLAALLSTIIVLVIVIGPFIILVSMLASEASSTIQLIENKVTEYNIEDIDLLPEMIRDSIVGETIRKIEAYSPITGEDILTGISEATNAIGSFIVTETKNIAKKVSILIVDLFIMLLSLYYFLRDGDKITKNIKTLIPLPKNYQDTLIKQLFTISKAIIYGIFGAALFQGAIAGVGYAIAGIDNAVFWGTITAFFSIVPYLGAAIVWVPITIIMLLTGHWVAAIFLLVWGVAVVSTVDNVIKPYLIGGKAHMYPLLTFFVIIGGIFTIGFKGLIIGPFALILMLTFLHIYRLEYKGILE
ncbi:MAG: AI-2E family transporter [Patescibacteria group bacterium]|nr:AI-2E family transporter [Patescibacteria group bacterium]